jgi:hypothetical protein
VRFYAPIYPKLFNLVDSTDDISECIVNYVATTQTELVDARLKTSSTLKGYINCDVEGVFDDCFFVGTQIKKTHNY